MVQQLRSERVRRAFGRAGNPIESLLGYHAQQMAEGICAAWSEFGKSLNIDELLYLNSIACSVDAWAMMETSRRFCLFRKRMEAKRLSRVEHWQTVLQALRDEIYSRVEGMSYARCVDVLCILTPNTYFDQRERISTFDAALRGIHSGLCLRVECGNFKERFDDYFKILYCIKNWSRNHHPTLWRTQRYREMPELFRNVVDLIFGRITEWLNEIPDDQIGTPERTQLFRFVFWCSGVGYRPEAFLERCAAYIRSSDIDSRDTFATYLEGRLISWELGFEPKQSDDLLSWRRFDLRFADEGLLSYIADFAERCASPAKKLEILRGIRDELVRRKLDIGSFEAKRLYVAYANCLLVDDALLDHLEQSLMRELEGAERGSEKITMARVMFPKHSVFVRWALAKLGRGESALSQVLLEKFVKKYREIHASNDHRMPDQYLGPDDWTMHLFSSAMGSPGSLQWMVDQTADLICRQRPSGCSLVQIHQICCAFPDLVLPAELRQQVEIKVQRLRAEKPRHSSKIESVFVSYLPKVHVGAEILSGGECCGYFPDATVVDAKTGAKWIYQFDGDFYHPQRRRLSDLSVIGPAIEELLQVRAFEHAGWKVIRVRESEWRELRDTECEDFIRRRAFGAETP